MVLKLTPEEAARWDAHLKASSRKVSPGRPIPFSKKKKALKLYLETENKSYVCGEVDIARHTLNKILDAAGVV